MKVYGVVATASPTDVIADAAFIFGPLLGLPVGILMAVACLIAEYRMRRIWPLFAISEMLTVLAAAVWAYWSAFGMDWTYLLHKPNPTQPPAWLSALETTALVACDLFVLATAVVTVVAMRGAFDSSSGPKAPPIPKGATLVASSTWSFDEIQDLDEWSCTFCNHQASAMLQATRHMSRCGICAECLALFRASDTSGLIARRRSEYKEPMDETSRVVEGILATWVEVTAS